MASLEDTILTDLRNHVGVGTSVSALLGHNHDGDRNQAICALALGPGSLEIGSAARLSQ
jgi:hypothetical protein